MPTATGSFTVDSFDATPLDGDGGLLAHIEIGKTFSGGLTGTSTVYMTSARTAVDDSAGYVAIERVVGVVDDLDGTFVLQHSGVSNRGVQSLTMMVVPDSGTGSLEGLAGELAIVADLPGGHEYAFTYTIG
ncbi:MAG: hypothetical protein QOG52_1343 [Frankiaceae bacterium]|nr:hypothetical protein [Frankiaceae bacterium]